MTTVLEFIIWSPSPEMFTISTPWFEREVRWYGLLFAMGFIVGQQIMHYIFKAEGKDVKDVDQLTMYVVFATVIGARLGHCLFYNPSYYLANPIEIFKIWEGGLASHGGAPSIFLALYWYSRKHSDQSYLWVLDRIAIITLLAGTFIRFGNFMNSEIIGLPTGSDKGIVFARNIEDMILRADQNITEVTFQKEADITSDSAGLVPMTILIAYKRGLTLDESDAKNFFQSSLPNAFRRYEHLSKHVYVAPGQPLAYKTYKNNGIQYAAVAVLAIPRHPGQLYESVAVLLMFFLLAHIWFYHRTQIKTGFIFGLFMVMLWAERFFVEFYKENQEPWEAGMSLNMGQILSIPLFIVGVVIVIKTWGFETKQKDRLEG